MLLAGLYCLQPTLQAAPAHSNGKHDVVPANARDRALAHFKDNYAWVDDAVWYTTTENSLYCTFRQGNIRNRVFYDQHGNWQYTLLSYPPSVLAKSVTDLISENFHGYRLSFVNEIHTGDQEPTYVINLENNDYIKVVHVTGDNFEIRRAFDKK